MSVFYSVAGALTEPNLENALEQTLRVVAQDLRLDAAWVWLLDEDSNAFYLAASYDLPPYLREPLHMTGEPCWCIQAFFDGDFISRNIDVMSCSRLQEGVEEIGPGATRGLRSHASIALQFGDRALGLLNAARAQNPSLTQAELETLATVGAQVGVAVERSRLAERAAVAARVEERVAIARELHDTIVQDLTAIALHLESAQRKTASEPVVAMGRISTAIHLTRNALDELRKNMDGLRNDPLAGEPLTGALSRLARRFTSETGIQVAFRGEDITAPIAAPVEFAAYRIAAEALVNIQRHAQARRVELRVETTPHDIVLRIHDDGSGFDPDEPTSGLGIVGMKERAERLSGILHIVSSAEIGTTIDVSLPLDAQ